MAVEGDLKVRFTRSYIFLNPDPEVSFTGFTRAGSLGTVGTWRLSVDDEDDGPDNPDEESKGTTGTALVAGDQPNIAVGNLLYLGNDGLARLADASDPDKSVVVGAALNTAAAGDVVTWARNVIADIFNTAAVVDNDTGGVFITGFKYYLSSENPGNWTLTPDTTTPGVVVLECGQSSNTNQMVVEIQTSTEI